MKTFLVLQFINYVVEVVCFFSFFRPKSRQNIINISKLFFFHSCCILRIVTAQNMSVFFFFLLRNNDRKLCLNQYYFRSKQFIDTSTHSMEFEFILIREQQQSRDNNFNEVNSSEILSIVR